MPLFYPPGRSNCRLIVMDFGYRIFLAAVLQLLAATALPAQAFGNSADCSVYTATGDQAWCQSNSFLVTPVLAVRISAVPDGPNQPILTLPAAAPAQVFATAIGNPALNAAAAAYDWKQVVPVTNSFAATGTATFSSTHTTTPQVTITLPASGVYQFQVTASAGDGSSQASTYFWVNVWENKTAVSPGNIGRNPGVTPPASVRMLTADPGPFRHPRLLFTKGDWTQLSANADPSSGLPETQAAIILLSGSLKNGFDKSGSPLNNLVRMLATYAADGYPDSAYRAICDATGFDPAAAAPAVPTIFKSTVLGNYPDTQLSDALSAAAYLAWLSIDPGGAPASGAAFDRITQLATVTAAYCRFLLTTEFINPAAFTGANSGSLANYSLALAYDLTYDYMTEDQRTDTRSYLFTIGNLYNYCCGGITLAPNRTVPAGSAQNGVDFPNLADGIIQPAMAIEGEESTVLPEVLKRADLFGPYIAAAQSTDKTVTPASSWPYASQVSVRNLARQVRANSEYILTHWGFYQNMEAYFQLGQNVASPGTLAYARRGGENQWVTTNLYQSMLHPLYHIAPREAGGALAILDPHDGAGFAGGDAQRNFYYIAKYMYPDDPLIDYIYRQATAGWTRNALARAIFGSPLSTVTMSEVAQAKQLPLTKFDPLVGFAISRNGWNETDLALVMNNFTWGGGHYHAEANSFALFAQGRIWVNPPGYHIVPGDAQAQVLIQMHPEATDASQGYIGQGPGSYDYAASVYNGADNPGGPFHGVLLEVSEDPNGNFTWFSGDAGPAYGYVTGTPVDGNGRPGVPVNTGLTAANFLIPGLTGALIPSDAQSLATSTRFSKAVPYNPVSYAYRGILTVRGGTPYVLVIDDINKDGTNPYNYRWSFNNSIDFGPPNGIFLDAKRNQIYSSLEIMPGATSTDAILYHDIDAADVPGAPRLLVRDLSENDNSGQPTIRIEDRPIPAAGATVATNLTYGYDNNSKKFSYFNTRRLFIERRRVVEPKYKVLLYPCGNGAPLPVTSWDSSSTVLTVTIGNQTDTITLDNTQPDHRTRLQSFSRSVN